MYNPKAFPGDVSDGMQLRDYFAIRIFPILWRLRVPSDPVDVTVKAIYNWADAMVAESEDRRRG